MVQVCSQFATGTDGERVDLLVPKVLNYRRLFICAVLSLNVRIAWRRRVHSY